MRRCDATIRRCNLFFFILATSFPTKHFCELKLGWLEKKMPWHSCYLPVWCCRHLAKVRYILSDLFSSFFSTLFCTWRKHPAQPWKIAYLDRDILIPYICLDSSHLEKKARREKKLVFCRAISIALESFDSFGVCLVLDSSISQEALSKDVSIPGSCKMDVSLPFDRSNPIMCYFKRGKCTSLKL